MEEKEKKHDVADLVLFGIVYPIALVLYIGLVGWIFS